MPEGGSLGLQMTPESRDTWMLLAELLSARHSTSSQGGDFSVVLFCHRHIAGTLLLVRIIIVM